ncbi:SMC-Scp complex subunit ScpB [Parafrankia discariae]|uniref:SMC-Scp complex subunit ScpB n=1 Tax=Parafrankia discariae TaxID=365528 RepID=UPI000378B1A8|nr:SMC-Scp complex subunit ScpB [Parafrankia discariae]
MSADSTNGPVGAAGSAGTDGPTGTGTSAGPNGSAGAVPAPRSPGPRVSSAPPAGDRPSDSALVEAVLTVAEHPVGVAEFATALDIPARRVEALLAELAAQYERDGRGFRLRHVGRGWRLYTADECAPWVERFVLAGQSARLSQAALETLAIVAYQQPVSRGRISAVRGVSADGVIRTLTARNLVEECGHDHESGAILYRTTDYFLERMGLRDLDELPPLAPLLPGVDDVDDIVAS